MGDQAIKSEHKMHKIHNSKFNVIKRVKILNEPRLYNYQGKCLNINITSTVAKSSCALTRVKAVLVPHRTVSMAANVPNIVVKGNNKLVSER